MFGGLRVGIAAGLHVSPIERGAGSSGLAVTFDTAMQRYTPVTAAEWAAVLAAAGDASGGPASSYAMQEAAGDLADSIGARTFTAAGAPAYLQTIAGATRKAVVMTDGGANKFTATIGAGNTTSLLAFGLVALTGTPAATRSLIQHPNLFAEVTTTPMFQANGGSVVTGTAAPSTSWHAMWLRSNVTTSAQAVITEAEVLAPTWFADTTTSLVLGGNASATAPMAMCLGAIWEGASAEKSNATLKAIMQAMAWTVAW